MRYFPLLDFQIVILLTFLGLAVLILLYVAFRGALSERIRSQKTGTGRRIRRELRQRTGRLHPY